MNIHLLTYLTNRIFWFYTVYRYNSALYVKEKNPHRWLCYVFSYVIGCCANMCLGTIKGNVIFNLLGLVLIAQSYPADTKHRIWNILMVYMTGILCDAIPIAMCINRVKNRHLGPGLIVIGNFLFFVVESLMERKLNVKRGYQIKTNHWLVMLSVPVLSIAVCISIMNPEEHRIRESMVLFLLFINILIFYLYDEVQKSYEEETNRGYMEIQLQQYAKRMDVMQNSQERLNKLRHDYKHHMHTIRAMAQAKDFQGILRYVDQIENVWKDTVPISYTENKIVDNLLNYILQEYRHQLKKLEISVHLPPYIGAELFDLSIVIGNLLDNAIRGAMESKERSLNCIIHYEKGILRMQVKNSAKEKVLRKGERYLSTKKKKEGHGIGLENVRYVVEKHQGDMEIISTDHEFQIRLFLYMNLGE